MIERKRVSPLKIGLVIVALAYFLFNAHTLFTLQWVGEWNRFGGFSFPVFIEDITSFVGVIFRFIAQELRRAGCVAALRIEHGPKAAGNNRR